jgi:hypothetical protein
MYYNFKVEWSDQNVDSVHIHECKGVFEYLRFSKCVIFNYPLLVNYLSRMMEKSTEVHKKTFLLKSITKQHIKIKIITYLCLIKEYRCGT